ERSPNGAVREAMVAWAVTFALIIAAFIVYRPAAKLVATAGFLYVPMWLARRRGEDARHYGLRFDVWRGDLALAAAVIVMLVPVSCLVSFSFVQFLNLFPPDVIQWLPPLHGRPNFGLRSPPQFGTWAVDQLFVVALPEEFFYRGFIQTRLRDA